MIGAPTRTARSMILQIFSACASDSEPPKTVKSWLNTNTSRPSIVPWPGDDAVAQVALAIQPEIRRPMGNERVELHERIGVEQQLEALARGQLAAFVLLFDAFLTAAEETLSSHLLQTRELRFFRVHEPGLLCSGWKALRRRVS